MKFLYTCLVIQALSCQMIYTLYSEIIDDIGVIPYTPAQRIQVAESVKQTFKVYVNKQSKIDTYKDQYPQIDPTPRIDNILAEAASLSDIDFHYKFVDLFRSLRDLHTEYVLPGPHRCVKLRHSVLFDVVGEGETESVVVSDHNIKKITDSDPHSKKIHIGDRLISISGKQIKEYISSLQFISGGAGHAGSLRASLKYLSNIDGANSKLPNEADQVFEFMALNGTIYQLILPWISEIDSDCWVQSKAMKRQMKEGRLGAFPPALPKVPSTDTTELLGQVTTSDVIPSPGFSNMLFKTTTDYKIDYLIHLPETLNLGIIKIKSFRPSNDNTLKAVMIIRDLLLNELARTASILLDVRSNKGGFVLMADMIPQLFASDIKTANFKALSNQISKDLFSANNDHKWVAAFGGLLNNPKPMFTTWVKETENDIANRIGQVYVKPVGIFTNGGCYSACEMLVANMKDNNIASVFGEDNSTGGGGAVVINYQTWLNYILPTQFPSLPFVNESPLAAQNIKIARLQYIRLDGSIVEDFGVKSDYIIRPIISDFFLYSKSKSQYDRIAHTLYLEGARTRQNQLNFRVRPEENFNQHAGISFDFKIASTGFIHIRIINDGGETVETIQPDSSSLHRSAVNIKTTGLAPRYHRYNIRGYTADLKLAFSTYRTIGILPKLTDYLMIQGSLNLDISENTKYMGIYNDLVKTSIGWKVSNKQLTISGSDRDVITTASFFLHCSENYSIFVGGEYLTPKAGERFRIGYVKIEETIVLFDTDDIRYPTNDVAKLNHLFQIPDGFIQLFFDFSSYRDSECSATIKEIEIMV